MWLFAILHDSIYFGVLNLNMSHQNKDVLHAPLMELLHHLWEVPKSPRVKSENPAFICIIQIVPLHILMLKDVK